MTVMSEAPWDNPARREEWYRDLAAKLQRLRDAAALLATDPDTLAGWVGNSSPWLERHLGTFETLADECSAALRQVIDVVAPAHLEAEAARLRAVLEEIEQRLATKAQSAERPRRRRRARRDDGTREQQERLLSAAYRAVDKVKEATP